MHFTTSIVVGALYAAGFFLILRRNIAQLVVGVVVLGHATNLLILTAGGLSRGSAPLIAPGAMEPQNAIANPLTQALILTAIVIGLALQGFLLVLVVQTARSMKTVDAENLREE